jgi:recombinational DNA repair protein (RecF pathway)
MKLEKRTKKVDITSQFEVISKSATLNETAEALYSILALLNLLIA